MIGQKNKNWFFGWMAIFYWRIRWDKKKIFG